jgi:hypothetical protein
MKTMLATLPQSSGYPPKIIESTEKENVLPVVPFNKEISPILPPGKNKKIADTPEAWDESWFANYE